MTTVLTGSNAGCFTTALVVTAVGMLMCCTHSSGGVSLAKSSTLWIPWHHFLGKLICQTGGRAGSLWPGPVLLYFKACGYVPHTLPHSLFTSISLCVRVCVCVNVSVCRLQTDQLSGWAQHQAAGRSMSHMWLTKQEAVRLGSNDLSMLGKEWVHLFWMSHLC